jgi:crotonobetainyl-CoA:carnitine CoA-transferase CaiB-like acyl-CoA transferase
VSGNPGLKSLLSPYRALDITSEDGYFCTKILSDLGVDVIRLEKPGTKRDFWWWAYNYNKTTLQIDIEKEPQKVLELAREVDFLVETYPPGYLDSIGLGYNGLAEVNPQLIVTSITPFGQTGPYKDYKASDLEIMALSGVMYVLGYPDRPPVRISFPQSYLLASAEAAVGTLIAHHWRVKNGEGQHVDVSAQESAMDVLIQAPFFLTFSNTIPKRTGKHRLGVSGGMFLHPMIWQCSDGHISYMMQGGKLGAYSNRTIATYIEKEGDLPDYMKEIDWDNLDMAKMTQEKMELIWEPFARFFKRHTVHEVYQISLKERLQLFPVNSVKDTLEDKQLNAREFWEKQEITELGKTLYYAGPYARISCNNTEQKSESDEKQINKSGNSLPFEGLKVADFSWVAAVPSITNWLAGFGAEVIKIESSSRLDATRVAGPFKDNKPGADRAGMFYTFNGSKKSFTLNLNAPSGRELAKKLVKWADVVVESFAPGMMKKWGLDFDELRKFNPGIIMLSASMMGGTGPHAAQPGLGLQLTSLSGFSYLTGWPDYDPPFIWGAYTDIPASKIGATILYATIDYHRRTGKSCYIDLSQYETSLHFLSPLILEYQLTGNPGERMGNRSSFTSPHGVFPCKGDDRWCALSTYTENEWRALCKVMGMPAWCKDSKFATFEKRKENEDELETNIATWTAQFTREELMSKLQQAGINAGMVEDCADLYNDPQLKHRQHFIPVTHPNIGKYDYYNRGYRLSKVSIKADYAPVLGEHNEYVCTGILGISDEEFCNYLAAGILE